MKKLFRKLVLFPSSGKNLEGT